MRNLIIFLSTFTATILIVMFMSAPANASGAGGSWEVYPPNPQCPTSTNPYTGGCSGGSTGGGGSGVVTPPLCKYSPSSAPNELFAVAIEAANLNCAAIRETGAYFFPVGFVFDGVTHNKVGSVLCGKAGGGSVKQICKDLPPEPEPEPEPDIPLPPPFPDLPPPTPDCNVCAQLYQIQLKLNVLKNFDMKVINQTIFDMSQVTKNIDNSITALNVEMNTTNNHLTEIDNSIGDMITNIENNTITNNEIKNEINNIKNVMNDYSLQLGNIELAMGDIDLSLKNTNKLVLDLGLDLDFIKNKLVNGGGGDSKDYTPYLNRIIELLEPCELTEEQPCEPTDEEQLQIDLLDVLVSLDDFIKEDFTPSEENTEIPVTDLTDINLDSGLINFGAAQCPPDNEFSTMVNGFAFSGGFKHKPLCDFFTMLAPFVKAFGGFSAALILGGGLRRG